MSLLFCLCVFCGSFVCSISLLLLSGSLSYILNSVIYVIVHVSLLLHWTVRLFPMCNRSRKGEV